MHRGKDAICALSFTEPEAEQGETEAGLDEGLFVILPPVLLVYMENHHRKT